MPFVVTGNCTGCRFTDCVAVCPVDCFHADDTMLHIDPEECIDCFHADDTMLYIDPEECIDCAACGTECPVDAIFDAKLLPDDMKHWERINAERALALPVVQEEQYPLPGAIERKKKLGHQASQNLMISSTEAVSRMRSAKLSSGAAVCSRNALEDGAIERAKSLFEQADERAPLAFLAAFLAALSEGALDVLIVGPLPDEAVFSELSSSGWGCPRVVSRVEAGVLGCACARRDPQARASKRLRRVLRAGGDPERLRGSRIGRVGARRSK